MGLWSNLLTGQWDNPVPIAPCISEASEPCNCQTGNVDSRGHLVCGCGNDHGEYAGPNRRS